MKRVKKSLLIPSVLLIYLAFMAYMGRDKLLAGSYLEYFGILIVTLLCILILFFTLRKQEEVRERRRRELEERDKSPKETSDEDNTDTK